MPAITLTTLQTLKQKGEKITMLTCYDATFAHACNEAGVEVLLVGDSLGMVLQGHDSTLPVTTAEMAYHVACVKRGNSDALILADLPFMANATVEQTLINSATLMQAGAHMVKVEGALWLAESIRLLAERGVPVCAHMGLTPQTVHALGIAGTMPAGVMAAQFGAMVKRMHAGRSSQSGLYGALFANLGIAVAKFVAAAITSGRRR